MNQVPEERSKPFAPLRVQLQILIGGTLILLFGLLVAPRTTQPPRPSETPTPILTEQTRTFEATALMQRVASTAAPVTVVFPAAPQPPLPGGVDDWRLLSSPPSPATLHGGLIVSPEGDILTAVGGPVSKEVVAVRLASGQRVSARVRVFDGDTGLALVRLEGLGPFASATLATEPPASGETLVGTLATDTGGLVASALVIASGVNGLVLSGVPAGLASGLPLFSPNGEAVAVAGPTGQGASTALLASAFLARADRLVARQAAMPAASGVSLQALQGSLVSVFGDRGVLISDVLPGSPAEAAGLRAGDVLLAVGSTTVSTPDEATRALAQLAAGAESDLVIRRASAELTMGLTPDRLLEARWLTRRPSVDPSVPTAGELATPAQLDAAGVPAESRVRLVEGLPATRRMRRPVSGLIYAETRGRPFFAVLPAPAPAPEPQP